MAQGSKYFQANSNSRKLGLTPAVAGTDTDGKLTFVSPDGSTASASDAADAAITAALGEDGDITTAITGAITAALGEDGAIATAIAAAIEAHLAAYQHTPVG